MKTYSMNDYVYFKLTETGRDIMNKHAKKFHRDWPKFDGKYFPDPWRGEWYKQQLHWVFDHFGGNILEGSLLPIIDITFEEPEC